MKKLLIIFGLLTVSSNVFSMNEEQKEITNAPQQNKLTKWEKVKVGSALAGCAFFSWATLFNRNSLTTYQAKQEGKKSHATLKQLPTAISLVPFCFLHSLYNKYYGLEMPNLIASHHPALLASSLLAFLCGRYAYKKLAQPKTVAIKEAIIS